MAENVTTLEDTSLIAYLMYSGFAIRPWRSREPTPEESQVRVSFDVEGDISEAVSDYYANRPVLIQDFVKCLKSVRSSMFNLKMLNKGSQH